MKTIKQKYLINAAKEKVWQALVDPKKIDDWGGEPTKMSEKEGEEFSKVTFKLTPKGERTEVVLFHEGVPDNKYEDIKDGWSRYYLGPLKELVERS